LRGTGCKQQAGGSASPRESAGCGREDYGRGRAGGVTKPRLYATHRHRH
jgi:hypothetical protein